MRNTKFKQTWAILVMDMLTYYGHIKEPKPKKRFWPDCVAWQCVGYNQIGSNIGLYIAH